METGKKYKKILIAFRTHYWNDTVSSLAKKLFGSVAEADFCVVADETRTTISCAPFEKVSHTSDMAHLGLPHWPESYNNLHYNGDYVFYELRKQKPDYDFYFLIENDCTVNIDFDALFARITHEKLDVVAQIDEVNSPQHAEHHAPAKKWFSDTGRVFFPFVGLSGSLVDDLYSQRLSLKDKITEQNLWPYCELYVASLSLSNKKYNILNTKDVYDLKDFTFMGHKYYTDPKVLRKNSICHPVTGKEFVEKNLLVNDPIKVFYPHSDLFTGISTLASENDFSFFEHLKHKITEKRDPEMLSRFLDLAFDKGWTKHIPAMNKAFGKSAVQSSICPSSSFQDVVLDAQTVTDGIITEATKSHTAFEENPWLEVDLNENTEVRLLLIYVRPLIYDVFKDFRVTFFTDSGEENIVYQKSDGIVPDTANLKPLVLRFPRGLFAQRVRITLLQTEALFLNQVEVYSY